MKSLYVGTPQIDLPPGGFLMIDDEVPLLPPPLTPDALYFDPYGHTFNPLQNLDYRKASDIVDAFDALYSRGESTLTKDTGLEFIAEALEKKPYSFDDLIPEPDKRSTTGHIWAYGKVRRLMRSPVLKPMLCTPTNFSFNPNTPIFARVNRKELGEFDALAIGLFLMVHYKGQLIIPDLGFYGRDNHSSLIREDRLIAGVHFLEELPEKLRRHCLLIPEKIAKGALYDDAELLAKHAGLKPDRLREDNEFSRYVQAAMTPPEIIEREMWKPGVQPAPIRTKKKRKKKARKQVKATFRLP